MSDRATRLAGLYAAIAAAASVLLSPLLALSYFGIPDGAEQLHSGTVRSPPVDRPSVEQIFGDRRPSSISETV